MIAELPSKIDFVLLDLWKDLYVPCLELFYPKLKPGAIIVADNMLFPGDADVRRYGKAIRKKPGITSVLLPVGTGAVRTNAGATLTIDNSNGSVNA